MLENRNFININDKANKKRENAGIGKIVVYCKSICRLIELMGILG